MASLSLLPSLARAELNIYNAPKSTAENPPEDGDTQKQTLQRFSVDATVYVRDNQPVLDERSITLTDLENITVEQPDGVYYRPGHSYKKYQVRMSDSYHATALKELLQEGKIKCLPLQGTDDVVTGETASFRVGKVMKAGCNATGVMALVNERATRDRHADENDGFYKDDLRGHLDRMAVDLKAFGHQIVQTSTKISDRATKWLAGESSVSSSGDRSAKAGGVAK